MMWILFKLLMTSGMVVLISEVAKKSDRLGGLIAALPLVTVMTLIWLYIEKQPDSKIANHAWYTFWYVVPTLPMFLAFPFLHDRIGFWLTMSSCVVITITCFVIFSFVVKQFGIDLI